MKRELGPNASYVVFRRTSLLDHNRQSSTLEGRVVGLCKLLTVLWTASFINDRVGHYYTPLQTSMEVEAEPVRRGTPPFLPAGAMFDLSRFVGWRVVVLP